MPPKIEISPLWNKYISERPGEFIPLGKLQALTPDVRFPQPDKIFLDLRESFKCDPENHTADGQRRYLFRLRSFSWYILLTLAELKTGAALPNTLFHYHETKATTAETSDELAHIYQSVYSAYHSQRFKYSIDPSVNDQSYLIFGQLWQRVLASGKLGSSASITTKELESALIGKRFNIVSVRETCRVLTLEKMNPSFNRLGIPLQVRREVQGADITYYLERTKLNGSAN